ncbi:MAG: sterol desaturase family protein, partial [Acidobacteriota bacterium]|nr:sterol desaturase family protein [Acidobacteriota bacterium]
MRIWISAGVFVAVFLLTSLAETIHPLRRRVEPRLRRAVRNLSTGALALAAVTLLQAPLLAPVAAWCERHGVGLLRLLHLPRAVETVLAVLLLDYTLWHWHRINHRVGFFWRFHLVHHIDRDMDASTGLRFHFGEMALSVGWRVLQIAAIGPSAFSVWLYQVLLASSVLFHHSNTRLPARLERVLVRLIVTPRMHGIHHSDWRNETDSNWSSLLSVWDALHRTLRLNVPQSEVVVGVPAYRDPGDVTLPRILAVPFSRQRDDWVGPQ